jgi:hypothetical protein
VGAQDEAALFEAGEVAADAGGRGADLFDQLLHGDISGAEQGFNDAVCANIRFGGHSLFSQFKCEKTKFQLAAFECVP